MAGVIHIDDFGVVVGYYEDEEAPLGLRVTHPRGRMTFPHDEGVLGIHRERTTQF